MKVHDASEKGARITVHRDATIPDLFTLEMLGTGQSLHCEVVWRGGDEIGVRFVTAAVGQLSVQLRMLRQMALAHAGVGRTFAVDGDTLVELRSGRRAGVWTFCDDQYRFTPSGSPSATLNTSDLFAAAEAATGQSIPVTRRR